MADALDLIAPDNQVHPFIKEPLDGPSSLQYRNIDGTGNHHTHYELGATDFLWQWGQFVDHAIDLTEPNAPFGPEHIRPETGDPFFDPDSTGISQIDFHRSSGVRVTGVDATYPRQQPNSITHYIDASNAYGSDQARAAALRTNDGTGRLAVSTGDLLPFNTAGFDNAGGTGPELFLAGDTRANEQLALTAMHTLFMREHNRLAGEIAAADPSVTGEEIYQRARQFVRALMQGITHNEFLPALPGPNALAPYAGYSFTVSPAIINCFSTAAYRFGHSALSSTILRGLAAQEMSAIDVKVVDGVRNFLFGDPTAGGLDLAALNIQRGRDHELPDYAYARLARGLGRVNSFSAISTNPDV